MLQNSYSQSVDSLPLKELNKEFLKGIEAREKLHTLKNIVKLDSIQLSLYKDSIVPNLEKSNQECKECIKELNTKLYQTKEHLYFFQIMTAWLAVLSTVLIIK